MCSKWLNQGEPETNATFQDDLMVIYLLSGTFFFPCYFYLQVGASVLVCSCCYRNHEGESGLSIVATGLRTVGRLSRGFIVN